MSRRTRKGKSTANTETVVTINLDGVEGTSRVPEGDYPVEVSDVTVETSRNNTQYLRFHLRITEGDHAGKTLRHQCSLQPHALFVLRNTLEALNYEIPGGAFNLDLEALKGLEMGVSVVLEDYKGKSQSQIVETFSVEELYDAEEEEYYEDEDEEEDTIVEDDEDDEDEEEEVDEGDEEEEEDEEDLDDYTEDELTEMDDEELADAAKEYDVEPIYTGRGRKKKLDRDATIDAIMDEIEEE